MVSPSSLRFVMHADGRTEYVAPRELKQAKVPLIGRKAVEFWKWQEAQAQAEEAEAERHKKSAPLTGTRAFGVNITNIVATSPSTANDNAVPYGYDETDEDSDSDSEDSDSDSEDEWVEDEDLAAAARALPVADGWSNVKLLFKKAEIHLPTFEQALTMSNFAHEPSKESDPAWFLSTHAWRARWQYASDDEKYQKFCKRKARAQDWHAEASLEWLMNQGVVDEDHRREALRRKAKNNLYVYPRKMTLPYIWCQHHCAVRGVCTKRCKRPAEGVATMLWDIDI